MGRLLVLLTTLLVLVMPVTELIFNWDHFLRGGQDVEFNLLAGLLFAAMVLLAMSGTMMQPLMLQPLLMHPLRMQPAFATMSDSCGQAASSSAGVGRYPQRVASFLSRSRRPNGSVSVFHSRALPPLRI